jgi:phosphoribosylformylglycinamidine synthase PurS subunit
LRIFWKDEGAGAMKATVTVMLKTGVLDPQGAAVKSALGALGFDGVEDVRQGKVIELDLAARHDRGGGHRDVRKAAGQHRDRKLPGGDGLMRAARLTGWRRPLEIGAGR